MGFWHSAFSLRPSTLGSHSCQFVCIRGSKNRPSLRTPAVANAKPDPIKADAVRFGFSLSFQTLWGRCPHLQFAAVHSVLRIGGRARMRKLECSAALPFPWGCRRGLRQQHVRARAFPVFLGAHFRLWSNPAKRSCCDCGKGANHVSDQSPSTISHRG